MPSTETVTTIRLTKDEADEVRKASVGEKLLARKAVIAHAEENATAFEDAFAKLSVLNQQGKTLYQSLKETAEASREALQIVREFFAHKKKGELLFGEFATGDAWAQARCGVIYGYVCRCLNPPKEQHLLKAVNETAQSAVSSKPSSQHVVELQALLADNTTKAVREQITRKVAKEISDAKKANEALTKASLVEQAAATKSALLKQAAEIHAEVAQQRQQDEQEAKRQQQLAVKRAVDTTQANALKLADKLPTKTTTALEANALDEAILILQGIVFTIDKSALKEKKYFRQAVDFLKARNAFQAPVVGGAS